MNKVEQPRSPWRTPMDIKKMRARSSLLPDPGGEIVRECLDEIDELTACLKISNRAWAHYERECYLLEVKLEEIKELLEGIDQTDESDDVKE